MNRRSTRCVTYWRSILTGLAAAITCGAVMIGSGCSNGSSISNTPVAQSPHSASRQVRPRSLVEPPASGDYLGAQVNPLADPLHIENQTETLEGQIYGTPPPRSLALHMHYRNWTQMLQIGSDPEVIADVTHGRVPVISWRCGDDAPPQNAQVPLNLIQIANGYADTDLANIKAQLMMLTYPGTQAPYPVVLRYFWEFNINAGQTAPAYDNPIIDPNGNNGCFVKPTTRTNVPAEPNAPPLPQQFTDAWNYIHSRLSGSQPIPLITYDWNPNVIDSDPQELGSGAVQDPRPYYPGTNTVDWIGTDGYQRLDPTSNEPKRFSDIFGQWYGWFAKLGKPLIIGETGSCANYGTQGYLTDQVAYLQSLQSSLESPSWSAIRAVMYFDATGKYTINGVTCDWSFDTRKEQPENLSGIEAYTGIALDPFFAPVVPTPHP